MKNKKIGYILTKIARYLFSCKQHNNFLYQDQLLKKFIKKNGKTEFGIKHNFANIKCFDDFRKLVPLHTYDSLQQYIERMLAGESNILWKGRVPFFSKSSGTTAVSKYIPITQQALQKNHFAVPRMGIGFYLQSNKSANIFGGKGIIMGGRMIPNPYNATVCNVGDVSAILQQQAPFFTRFFRRPTLKVSFMQDFNKKLDAIIDETIGLPITYVAGVPSRLTLFLKRITERYPNKKIADIRPDFELFLWGGISLAPYKKQLDNLLEGTSVTYRQTYNASEGFFAIQDAPNRNDMLLATTHHVLYEFIPFDVCGEENPSTVLLHELQEGKKYELVITADGGLWRYRIGDVIQVTSIYPLRIVVAGRTKSYLNAFGEELMVHTADGAIEEICKKHNLPRAEYVATPIVTNDGGWHHWYIEFDGVQGINSDDVAQEIDAYIMRHNSDYAAKRNGNLLMKKPVVTILQPNTFHSYLASKGKLGGQHKIKRLRNNRDDLMNELGNRLQ